jgi:hypothetical protein
MIFEKLRASSSFFPPLSEMTKLLKIPNGAMSEGPLTKCQMIILSLLWTMAPLPHFVNVPDVEP